MSEREIFPSKDLVLGFHVFGDYFMLSIRRRTPWLGCFSGLGGNVEDEDLGIFDAMRREAEQEAGIVVCPSSMKKVGEFKIFRQGKQMVKLHIIVFSEICGKLTVSDEMGPHMIFPKEDLPMKSMVSGDEFWVKRILDGENLMGEIYRSADSEELIDIKVWACDPF